MLTPEERARPGMANMAKAFEEWHRRWTEEPARFDSEAESMALPGDTYGEGAARYFASILDEQRSAREAAGDLSEGLAVDAA